MYVGRRFKHPGTEIVHFIVYSSNMFMFVPVPRHSVNKSDGETLSS